jgi:hypothetical protein
MTQFGSSQNPMQRQGRNRYPNHVCEPEMPSVPLGEIDQVDLARSTP